MDPEIEDYYFDSDFEPHKNLLEFFSISYVEMKVAADYCGRKIEDLISESEQSEEGKNPLDESSQNQGISEWKVQKEKQSENEKEFEEDDDEDNDPFSDFGYEEQSFCQNCSEQSEKLSEVKQEQERNEFQEKRISLKGKESQKRTKKHIKTSEQKHSIQENEIGEEIYEAVRNLFEDKQ